MLRPYFIDKKKAKLRDFVFFFVTPVEYQVHN